METYHGGEMSRSDHHGGVCHGSDFGVRETQNETDYEIGSNHTKK